ncbi:c-type cytochrome [soil metagenome]
MSKANWFGRFYFPVVLYLILFVIGGLTGCNESHPEPEKTYVSDEDALVFAERIKGNVYIDLAENLSIDLWASEKLIGDPVAIDIDHQGRALITVTNRRYTSSLDIRDHPDWTTKSLKMNSTEDRRAFLHDKLDAARSDENSSWLMDHNNDGIHDWRDLKVEQEEVYTVEDLTGNCLANQAQLFYRGFNDETSDLAGAVLSHSGDVFVGAAPDMWRLRDTNADGMGDLKESVSHGYGIHIGMSGHGISGLITGPDARIYWSIGDIALNVVDKEGKQWENTRKGAILRSEPDGSNFEVFATGLRNTHEFTFDKYGNLITVDNDGDFPGEFERVVHLIDGSDSGWRIDWQFGKYTDPKNNNYNVWVDERYFHPEYARQVSHILPPLARYHNGPAGMVYNPGTALGEEWENHFFVASFVGSPTNSGIDAFTLEPKGASFELSSDVQVMRGILATGMSFGPDGALYIADWIEGWPTNDEGRIWKMESSEESYLSISEETSALLGSSFDDQSGENLVGLMGHKDMRVRQKAQFKLVNRADTENLMKAIDQREHQLRRIHGIWGIGQLGRSDESVLELLFELFDDPDPEIRAQTARIMGDVRYNPAGEPIIRLLYDDEKRVRLFASEALGRLSYHPALESIIEMLEINNDEDYHLRHAAVIALERIGDGDEIAKLNTHSSTAVRVAVVAALGRLGHPAVALFLDDEDEGVVTNAARAINDDGIIMEALEHLSKMLEQTHFTNEPLIRRAINAAIFNGEAEDAIRLAQFSNRSTISDELRAEALYALSVWESPSVLNRVTGQYHGEVENDLEQAHQALYLVVTELLKDENELIRVATVEAVNRLEFLGVETDLAHILESDGSPRVRISVLKALRHLEYEELEQAFYMALEDEHSSVREQALDLLTELDLPAESITGLISSALENGVISDQQTALRVLGRLDDPAAHALLEEYLIMLNAGEISREIELDLLEAAEQSSVNELNILVDQFQNKKPVGEVLAQFRESLYGGDPDRGRSLFFEHGGAQCIRCHFVNGEGSDVGPDLTEAGERFSREQLLEAMVAPNARVAPGYGTVSLTLENGQTHQGTIIEEAETFITIRSRNDDLVIEKDQIIERENSPSGMPPMGNILSKSELRDLVEFLSGMPEE